MKKIVLTLLSAVLLGFGSEAQISKGSLLIGGSIGFGNNKTEADNNDLSKISSYNIFPSVGVAVKQNVVVGIMLGYGRSKEEFLFNSPSQTVKEQTTLTSSIFLRRYFPISSRFYAYGQGNAGYQHYKNEQQRFPGTETFRQNIYFLSASPGISFELSRKFHLEAGFTDLLLLSYDSKKTTQENVSGLGTRSETSGNGFGLQVNASPSNQFNIGFRFLLNKRKA